MCVCVCVCVCLCVFVHLCVYMCRVVGMWLQIQKLHILISSRPLYSLPCLL